MFGLNPLGINKGLNFISILNGLSKSLNLANQIIPMYHKAKPFVINARELINSLKNIEPTNNRIISQVNKKEEISLNTSSNNPKFFI